jgi:hypothetical protein
MREKTLVVLSLKTGENFTRSRGGYPPLPPPFAPPLAGLHECYASHRIKKNAGGATSNANVGLSHPKGDNEDEAGADRKRNADGSDREEEAG